MTRHIIALAAGLALGGAFSGYRHAGELAALDRDLAHLTARREACEEALAARVTSAAEQVASDCALAASACSTCAQATVEAEQRARSFLQLGPGPRVDR